MKIKWFLKQMKKVSAAAGTLLYPYRCPFCQKVIRQGICEECREKIVDISEPYCMKCGKPIRNGQKEYCSDCEKQNPAFEAGRSLWLHREPVNGALYRFKYHKQRYYGAVFADCLYERFKKELSLWQIDAIMPVPLHRKKFLKRGYNQAEIIADRLGERTGIPVRKDLVFRTFNTSPLKELGPQERRKNLQRAFEAADAAACCNNVLIIDDIYTTGATIGTIARKMKQKGTRKVYFFTISIGQGF